MAPLSRPTSAPDSLKFVQNALAKTEYDEDLDITPLATSVHKNQPTTRSSTVITTATSKNPMMIPNSYSVPDETYTKRVFDRFISLLKQVHFLMLTGISKWYCYLTALWLLNRTNKLSAAGNEPTPSRLKGNHDPCNPFTIN